MLKKILLLFFGVFIPLVLIVVAFVGYGWVFDSNVNLAKDKTYELFVMPEDDPRDVLNKLVKDSIIKNQRSFILVAQQKKWLTAKSGRYIIRSGMSNNELVNMLRGGLQTPVQLVINQVTSIADVAQAAGNQLMIDSAEIFQALVDPEFMREKNLSYANIRSIIIPNTYEVYWNAGAESLRRRLVQEYDNFWNESRRMQAEGMQLTPIQVSVLASIVEKETAKVDEMPIVAGLYLNRLKKGMKLQSDPTVIFAKKLIEGDDIEIRRVLYADLEIDSEYNTYKYAGLPPGPITIPSTQALLAVLHPQKNEYIYMCADPDRPGYHSFAKNDAQHAVNKKKWVKWLNDNKIMR